MRIAAGLAALAFAGPAAADWTPVAQDNGIFAAYADLSTLRVEGAVATMHGLYDFARGDLTPEGQPMYSTKVEREYDCRARRVRLLAYEDHAGRLGEGAVVGASRVPRAWEAIVEGSLDADFWKLACRGALALRGT